jgi:hypothetical protein
MKAKDWVRHILQFQPDTPEHDAAAEACGKECRAMLSFIPVPNLILKHLWDLCIMHKLVSSTLSMLAL